MSGNRSDAHEQVGTALNVSLADAVVKYRGLATKVTRSQKMQSTFRQYVTLLTILRNIQKGWTINKVISYHVCCF